MEVIYKLLENTKNLPASPQVLPKLLELLRNDDATLEEIGELITLEPALTAKLLQFCNSAYFSGSDPVSNVPDAIGRVGFKTIYTLVTIVTGSNILALPAGSGLDVNQLWQHSLTTAFGAKFVAEAVEADSNLLFTGGLLHDMGRVVLAKAKGVEYGRLLRQAAANNASLLETELSAFGFTHADVGSCLMDIWHLPKPLIESVRYHHNPSAGNGSKMDAACVCLGNALAHQAAPNAQIPPPNPHEQIAAMELLKIDDGQMVRFGEQMAENWSFIKTLLRN
jgi:putative nucleotidyltransferase with HDIG domain